LHEVFEGKAGVCQDFAHVMIAALRAHGLAAGTCRATSAPSFEGRDRAARRRCQPRLGRRVVRQKAGWVHLDPTNDLVASQDHVAIAWGRDFSDVSPLRGVILGGGGTPTAWR
jgi:transglutaminase-like putative cysteine protease